MAKWTNINLLDEDNMASDSATDAASQQSIKAYVDTQVGGSNEFSELTDVTGAYTTGNALYKSNSTPDGLEETTTLLTEPAANQFQIARGTSAMLVQADLTVEATSLINQDLTTDANVQFAQGVFQTSSPKYRMYETDAGSNEKAFQLYAVGGQLRWAISNDNLSGITDFMTLDRTANNPDSLNINADLTSFNGLIVDRGSVSLVDDAEITIATGVSGMGRCFIGDNQEYAGFFSFTAAGVVTLGTNISANVVNTDTDAKLCIYDAGSGIAIKNRLGSELTLRYVVEYS